MNMEGNWNPERWAHGINFDLEKIGTVPDNAFYVIEDQNFFTAALPAEIFKDLSLIRKESIEKYLWCSESNLYYDWDVSLNMRSIYRTCTAMWSLYAGIPTIEKAKMLIKASIENFKVTGGLVSGTEESKGEISLERPDRQWDYPYGWAPHQILAWKGLTRYGYHKETLELTYRWLYTVTKTFVDFNGTIPGFIPLIRKI